MNNQFLETELKCLLIQALGLEDIEANELDSDLFLFGDELGLDSLDAIAFSVALKKRFDLDLELAYQSHREHLVSIRTLVHVIQNRHLLAFKL